MLTPANPKTIKADTRAATLLGTSGWIDFSETGGGEGMVATGF